MALHSPGWKTDSSGLSHNGKTERRGREREMPANVGWREEGKNKGKGEQDGEFHVSSVETAVGEQLALWKHLETHQSKELHLHCCLCVCACESETCTVHMQACVTAQVCVCVWSHLCDEWHFWKHTFGVVFTFLYAELTHLAGGLSYNKFPPTRPKVAISTLPALIRTLIEAHIEGPYKQWDVWTEPAKSWHRVPILLILENYSGFSLVSITTLLREWKSNNHSSGNSYNWKHIYKRNNKLSIS